MKSKKIQNSILFLLIICLLLSKNLYADSDYDVTGTWSYVTSNSYDECTFGSNHSDTNGKAIINQNGDSVSMQILSEDSIAVGAADGSNYYMTVAVTGESDGVEITVVKVWEMTFSSAINGFGTFTAVAYQTDGTFICTWGSDFIMTLDSQINTSPSSPILFSPVNGSSDVSLTPTLTTNAFSDPDAGDTHSKTEWVISTSSDFSSSILYESSITNLTSLTVPASALQEGTTYYWRVKFYDNRNTESDWSRTFSFTTLQTQNDTNENGIPDTLENNTVDLDNDGIADIQQETIKSLNTVIGYGQMGASIKDSTTVISIDSINSIDIDDISKISRPAKMTLGLFSFRLTVANAGDTADVTIYFSEAAPTGAIWYFYNSIDDWLDYSAHTTFSQDRKSVRVELKDGGYGDSDGIANGVIVDPSGFGIASWIKGFVSDSLTNTAITTATIAIKDLDLSLNSRLEGNYIGMILPGTYDVDVSAPGYQSQTLFGLEIMEGDIVSQDITLSTQNSNDAVLNAVIKTVEAGNITAVWQKGGEDTTSRGDRVVWGYFYADPNDVSWGSINNPEVFAKIWYDAGGRVDVNFFHVSVADIEVSASYNGVDLTATATTTKRYIRHYYNDNNSDGTSENTEDGIPVTGYNPSNNPYGYPTINNLDIGAIINTVEAVGSIDALWTLGGTDTTSRGDQVVWGYFYADPNEVSWGSKNNPELFVKIWFDAGGRIDVNYFHVSVPDIEVYSDYGADGIYDNKGTTIMDDRYIRHEYVKQ